MGRFFMFFALVLFASSAAAQTAPPIDTQALDGTSVHLPDHRHPTVLAMAFSRKASDALAIWGRQLSHEPWNGKQAAVYEAGVLAAIPKPVRGFVLRSMRKQIPAAVQSHFLALYTDEKRWRELAGVTAEDDVYVLLLDADGNLRSRTHGQFTEAALHQITAQISLFSTE